MLKLHCLAVSAVNRIWLYAYFRSSTVKYSVPVVLAVTIWLISSNNFGIWYLFMYSCLFIGFASNANLIESSFFTVITIGAIKQSLVHLSRFVIWPSDNNFSSSSCPFSWIWMVILLPFSCIGHSGYLNFVLTMWFFDSPWRSNRDGNFS